MKRIFLALLLVFSINLSSFATYQVNYNAAGGVTSTTYTSPYGVEINNYPTSTLNGFGSNALFLPANAVKAAEQQRQRRYENAFIESLRNKNTHNININVNSKSSENTTNSKSKDNKAKRTNKDKKTTLNDSEIIKDLNVKNLILY